MLIFRVFIDNQSGMNVLLVRSSVHCSFRSLILFKTFPTHCYRIFYYNRWPINDFHVKATTLFRTKKTPKIIYVAYLQLKHNFYALLRILAVGKRVSFFSDFFHTLFFRLSQKTFKCRLLWTSCLFKKIAFLQMFRTWKFNILSICGKIMLKNHSKYHYGLGIQ